MTTRAADHSPRDAAEIQSMLRELQQGAVLPVLPGLALVGLAFIVAAGLFPDPLQGGLPGLLLLLLPAIVGGTRQLSRDASAWILAVGCPAMVFFLVAFAKLPAAIYLLPVAVGIAALSITLAGAIAVASACSLLLLVPSPPVPGDVPVRLVALAGAWGTLALVWLARRPLLTTTAWSWSSLQRGQVLLEQARDYQVQLKQTLADLADANLQLTRLNRQADGLRHAAEESRRAKQQFVANVSHELRTPLNMIIGFSEMIVQAPETYGDLPPTLLADLDVILRNSKHLSGLIDDVLDLSRVEAGRMALSKERVRLPEIVEAATAAVRPLFASKNLCLQTEVPEDLPPILCDRTRIREVLLNLLSNAGRFTERGGVHLRARLEGSDVIVSVADTGPGIAAEDIGRVFQPFRQLDGSIRRRYDGSGLGLSISKSFVELHGGRMWLASEKGVGTTLFFSLPVDEPAPPGGGVARWFSPYSHFEERTRRSMAPPPVVRPRFVVLEAGRSLRRLLDRYLDGVEVASVASLEEALHELTQTPAQALLINAASVAATLADLSELSGLPRGMPVVVCSLPGATEAAENLGAIDYLLKPVSREALLAALEKLSTPPRTILVVDDEPEALTLFWRMLSSAGRGYQVLTAMDGQEAMEVLKQGRPDVILLDLIMPNMDGFKLLEVMRQHADWQQVPVLVVSANDPVAQPIVSGPIAITRPEGLSAAELLACIEGISQTAPRRALPGGQALPESRGG